MFKRLSIFALTLVLTLGILAVPALAACNHVHDASCYEKQLVCGLEEHEHTWTNGCWESLWDSMVGGPTICGKVEHTHTDACYQDVLNCKHVHDESCGGLEPEEPDPTPDPEPVDPEPEQPASSGSNFIEPTYYADYEEDVVYLDPDAAEAADYAVTCRTLNVRKTPSTEYAPIAQIHRGDIVSVVDWEGDWAKIEWVSAEDGYAYVFGAYIEKL